MRKPNKNKMAGVNSRFASVSESIFNGFLLKMLLRSLPVYILKQLFFSISVRLIVNYLINKIALYFGLQYKPSSGAEWKKYTYTFIYIDICLIITRNCSKHC